MAQFFYELIGPNVLSIVDIEAVDSVLGPNGLSKGRCLYFVLTKSNTPPLIR